jgi:hypothetical protein
MNRPEQVEGWLLADLCRKLARKRKIPTGKRRRHGGLDSVAFGVFRRYQPRPGLGEMLEPVPLFPVHLSLIRAFNLDRSVCDHGPQGFPAQISIIVSVDANVNVQRQQRLAPYRSIVFARSSLPVK